MRKFLLSLTAVFTLMLFNAACVMAAEFGPGQRTIELLGGALNSDKHPVHLVVEQTIDMKEVLEPDAYAKLTAAQKVHYIRRGQSCARLLQLRQRRALVFYRLR